MIEMPPLTVTHSVTDCAIGNLPALSARAPFLEEHAMGTRNAHRAYGRIDTLIVRWCAGKLVEALQIRITKHHLKVARALQILRISPFRKPGINRPDEISRLVTPSLRLPKPGQASSCP
jgi:hypothetical protein